MWIGITTFLREFQTVSREGGIGDLLEHATNSVPPDITTSFTQIETTSQIDILKLRPTIPTTKQGCQEEIAEFEDSTVSRKNPIMTIDNYDDYSNGDNTVLGSSPTQDKITQKPLLVQGPSNIRTNQQTQ